MYPAPTASNTKANHMRGADKGKAREARSYGATGPLNPTWVEWLMGWPARWTEFAPLATDRFREWQRQHGACSEGQ
jgi:DNA (cytosine-5)-methyltransferase 1